MNCSKSPDQLGIYTETYTNHMVLLKTKNPQNTMGGYLGTWQSNPDNPTTVTVETKDCIEGKECLKVTTGEGPWGGGIWFQFGYAEGEGDPPKVDTDISDYEDGHLVFNLKTTQDILIKLESANKGESQRKVTRFKAKLDGKWQEVRIPLKEFTTIELEKINVVFGAHFIEPQTECTFWLDNIYLTKK